MPLQPLYYAPGICKTSSAYASSKVVEYAEGRIAYGRYIDCLNCRFVAGFPEKLGGWINLVYGSGSVDVATTGVPRCVLSWRDNAGYVRLMIATDTNVYVYDNNILTGTKNYTTLTDVTPFASTQTLTLDGTYGGTTTYGTGPYGWGPLAAIVSTSHVAITTLVATSQQIGDYIRVVASAPLNGVTINGTYPIVAQTTSPETITVDIGTVFAGAYDLVYGGGVVTVELTRNSLTNPFGTVNSSAVVTVTDTNWTAATNISQVVFDGSYTVNGVTISGQYTLTAVGSGSPNSYTITVSSNATSTGTGGGTVALHYLVATNPATYTSGTTPASAKQPGFTLARYGQQVLVNPIGGGIYVYDPTIGSPTAPNPSTVPAYPLPNAPTSVLAMFVTPERFVVALGIGEGGLELAWADQEDYTDWTTTPTNTANSGLTVQGGSFFVNGLGVRDGVSLIVTNRVAFQLSYTGGTFVYNRTTAGDNCGLIGAHAIVTEGENAYWMSDKDFWTWNGTVSSLPSDDIRDYVFKNINTQYQNKCAAGMNRAKREVWFAYPRGTAIENTDYVIYHMDQQCWSIGTFPISCWTDADLYSNPVRGSSVGNQLFFHESGVDAAGSAMDFYITAAPMDISNGDQNLNVFGVIPDFDYLTNDATLTLLEQYYPNDAITYDGPYTLSDTNNGATRLDLRADGKLVGFKLESNSVSGNVRLGLFRADTQPSGARR